MISCSKDQIICSIDSIIKGKSIVEDAYELDVQKLLNRFRAFHDLKERDNVIESGIYENKNSINFLLSNIPQLYWFDLMFCTSIDQRKKQEMYALFSKNNEIREHRRLIAKLYNGYVEKRPECNIDLILQLCYLGDKVYKGHVNENEIKLLVDRVHDAGLILCLTKQKNNKRFSYLSAANSPLVIHITEDEQTIINNTLSEFEKGLENYKIEFKEDISELSLIALFEDSINKSFFDPISQNRIVDKKNDCVCLLQELLLFDYNGGVFLNESFQKSFIRVLALNAVLNKDVKQIYFTTVPTPMNEKIGHFTCGVNYPLDSNDFILLRVLSYSILYPLIQIIQGNEYTTLIRRQSIKTAISAIMSRNMSHNLGSHVVTNAKHQIMELERRQGDNSVKEQLKGISALLQYLQERQDFIAVIANDEHYPRGAPQFQIGSFRLACNGRSWAAP